MKSITILLCLCYTAAFGQLPATGGYLLTNYDGSVSVGTRVNTAPLTVSNFQSSFVNPQLGTIIHIVSDTSVNGRISFDTYNNTTFTGSIFQGRRARGTAEVPLPPTTDDVLVAMGADGFGIDSFSGVSVGSVNIRAEAGFTNVSKPTYISFTTTPAASTTQVERMRIKSDGTVQITGLSAAGFVMTDASGNLSIGTNGSTLTGLSKSQVGLSNVDNTSDANKPVSTATQTALDLKANIASPTFTGTVSGITASMVGLGNVDNTSDLNKPISTATQTALDAKQATLVSNTNIKTVGGQSVLGSGNIVTTNSQTFVNLAANFSSTSTTPAAVTGWSFAVTNGITYRIKVIADYQTAATTTGGILGISLTTATGTVRGYAMGTVSNAAAATDLVIPIRATSGAGSTLTTTGVSGTNSPHYIGMDITFTCTASGTFNIVWGSEVNASAAQLNANSSLIYQALN